ncbi:MAG: hypothetical protein QF903_05915 [Planctomycetota bacterium]|jgi:hypothetical protein|nr:hypothetical protein [Planctomycetota bacterium]MDP6763936.1 hypothetical protein [Planctomycetota bacterium]MDP6988995.1 hypothetical protein [Planctomycetota bacterium]
MTDLHQRAADEPIGTVDCLSRGWELCKGQYGLLVVMGFLFMTIVNAQSAILPLPILVGPLTCGFFLALRTRSEGRTATLGQLFDGFARFKAAFFASLLHLAALVVTALPFGIAMGLCGLLAGLAFESGANVLGGCIATLCVLTGLLLALALLVVNTLVWFTYPLLAEHDLSASAAMAASARGARRHITSLIALNVALALLTCLATLFFVLPGLLLLPIVMAATWEAYRRVFSVDELPQPPVDRPGVAPIGGP